MMKRGDILNGEESAKKKRSEEYSYRKCDLDEGLDTTKNREGETDKGQT